MKEHTNELSADGLSVAIINEEFAPLIININASQESAADLELPIPPSPTYIHIPIKTVPQQTIQPIIPYIISTSQCKVLTGISIIVGFIVAISTWCQISKHC